MAIATNKIFQIYAFDGSMLTFIAQSPDHSLSVNALEWSPDGKYIAVGEAGSGGTAYFKIYGFNGTALNLAATATNTSSIFSVNWSPDGKYVASCNWGSGLQIYRFDGFALASVVSTSLIYPSNAAWSPDGMYIAVCDNDTPASGKYLRTFRFNGSSLVSGPIYQVAYSSSSARVCAWSPDGKYLIYGCGYYTNGVSIFSFTPSSLTLSKTITVPSSDYTLNAAAWSPDGKYLALGFSVLNSGYYLRLYSGITYDLVKDFGPNNASAIYSLSWRPDSKYIAVNCSDSNRLAIEQCLFKNETATQALSNSIIFGNSSLGPTYDLDVHVLSGAQVQVTGNVFHDPA